MSEITYKVIDNNEVPKIAEVFGEYIIQFNCFHFGEGCLSLVAYDQELPIGIISTYPLNYPNPLEQLRDAYIDVLEVDEKYRKQGIARELITRTENWARDNGHRQLRAWSSVDKKEAIPMWYALGYCMCPAKIWVEWCEEVVDGFYVAKKLL
jgi:GNAT superfamily N-acetyltransferase